MIPTISVVAFLGVMYAVHPHQISSSFLTSGFLLFVISVYISMSIQQREQDVHEGLFLLHSRSGAGYNLVREMVPYSIMLFYALILILYPVIRGSLKASWFTRPLEAEDILFGSILILANGICGVALGDAFHRRVIPRRRYAVIGVVLVAILAVCKVSIIEKLPFMKILNVLLPPLMDGFSMVGNGDRFDPQETLLILLHSVAYVGVIVAVKIWLLRWRKFS